MASLFFFFSVFSLVLFGQHLPTIASAPPAITQACKATQFPILCVSSLTKSKLPPTPSSLQVIQAAISVSSDNLRIAQSMVQSILDSSKGSVNRTLASKNCLEALHNSEYRTTLTTSGALPSGRLKDARAWMSASLHYQYSCWSSLKYANDTAMVNKTMAFLGNSLTNYTSNALSMLVAYDVNGKDIKSWGPVKTERDGFWEGSAAGAGGGSEFKGGFPPKLTADATVCKGGCKYKTVQAAVNAAPANLTGNKRFVIHIKQGVYQETVRVPLEKKNVVFLGDGMGKTVITGSLNVGQPGLSTINTATVGVTGDGFMASGLTIKNTAGPDAHQAVAFRSDSDLSVIENCEFIGNQDTLYTQTLRQFYKSCRIQGNVDFIFGNSASIFQDCQILVAPRQQDPEKGEKNTVTAHGRIDPAQSTGYVFQNCSIDGTKEYVTLYNSKPKVHKNYLGRPWKMYSRVVFIHCNLGALISPDGWLPWQEDFALATLFYGEFENSGPGSNPSKRVTWSTQIPANHISSFSVQNFIQGDQWIPSSQ